MTTTTVLSFSSSDKNNNDNNNNNDYHREDEQEQEQEKKQQHPSIKQARESSSAIGMVIWIVLDPRLSLDNNDPATREFYGGHPEVVNFLINLWLIIVLVWNVHSLMLASMDYGIGLGGLAATTTNSSMISKKKKKKKKTMSYWTSMVAHCFTCGLLMASLIAWIACDLMTEGFHVMEGQSLLLWILKGGLVFATIWMYSWQISLEEEEEQIHHSSKEEENDDNENENESEKASADPLQEPLLAVVVV